MKKENNKKRKWKLDKQSSANIVLAFTFICFMLTMFMFSNSIGSSFADENFTLNLTPEMSTLKSNFTNFDNTYRWWLIRNVAEPESDENLMLTLPYDFKATDSSGVEHDMYCVEGQKEIGTGTITYSNYEMMDDSYAPGLAYILNNGYPNSTDSSFMKFCDTNAPNYFISTIDNISSTGNVDVGDRVRACKKYLTQYAIWYYLDMVGYKDSNGNTQLTEAKRQNLENYANGNVTQATDVAQQVINFANEAKLYNDKSHEVCTYSIDTSDIKYTVTDDGKYLESNFITVSSTNKNLNLFYTAAFSKNNVEAVFIDSDGNINPNLQNVSANNKFKIRIPLDKLKNIDSVSLDIAMTVSYSKDVVYKYTPSVDGAQSPIVADKTKTTTGFTTSISLNLTEITKTDITNDKLVSGAQLSIKDSNGKEIARWITNNYPYYVNLSEGDYTLSEITSPDGYELNQASVAFKVKNDGTITKVVMKNTPTTDVPNTAENIPGYVYIIGGFILIVGISVIYVTVKKKKN